MQRKYRTSHQGIAAYILSQGHETERLEQGTTKAGKPTTFIEFDMDAQSGREMGDAFFNGQVHGNLKAFYDCLMVVKQRIWDNKK